MSKTLGDQEKSPPQNQQLLDLSLNRINLVSDGLESAVNDDAWNLPPQAWDCHVHVFDPEHYPYADSRAYSPLTATYSSLLSFEESIARSGKVQHIVLVQPSPYGTDNSLILDLLAGHDQEQRCLRAIAVIDHEKITDLELIEMQKLGVRGIRLNLEASGETFEPTKIGHQIVSSVARVSRFPDWSCQLFMPGEMWTYIKETIQTLPLCVIADHQGGMKALSALPESITDVRQQPGFSELVSLAKSGKVFVKISGLYRSSKLTVGGFDDLEPLIKELAKEVPAQLLWGSDWPHTGSGVNRSKETRDVPEQFRFVDDEAVLENVRRWVGEDVWYMMTVVTPKRVFS